MRSRVIAHRRLPNVSVHHGVDFVPHADRLFRDHLMRAHALNRVITPLDVGGDGVVIVGVEPSAVANFSPRLPVALERRFRKLLVCRIGSLLSRAFPGGARTRLLLLHRMIKSSSVERDSLV